jgi:hypothetical protein
VKEAYQKIAIADPIMGMDFAIHTPASVVLLLNVIERMDYHQYIDTEKPQRIVVTPERRS